jgi:hypothetical protein
MERTIDRSIESEKILEQQRKDYKSIYDDDDDVVLAW